MSSDNCVSKAFTEPFVRQVPLQTFTVSAPLGAQHITANSAFLFFNSESKVFALNKHGYTGMYYDMGVKASGEITSLIAYRNELLLFSDRDHISAVDVSHLQVTEDLQANLTENK
jgi:hypothetical protein